MRAMRIQNWVYRFFLILFVGVFFISCKNDDGEDSNPMTDHSIDVVLGTFKGTLNSGGQDYFNAIVMVSKVDDSHVKVQAKTNESYSFVTTKTLTAVNTQGVGVVGNNNEGSIDYLISTKALMVSTQKTSETDKIYLFQGTKQ
ncbi:MULTISPECIES: hypothetical protein [Chryseobacterium]|uniref:hypothetical protein n=1 Tax=Chryseobacterium TaxID=59732 RepID=UPI001BE5601B|nr:MULTISPECIES: hypothetical protein [Chryseobacterium]MBT2619415.1 hypothetical protein [Chryseobacterium sp. ISL-6]